jgi:diguanylate cyclase (GGDEF)-like protein/PAS domain S-box-containing protein
VPVKTAFVQAPGASAEAEARLATVPAGELVRDYPGPALVSTPAGVVAAVNEHARGLASALAAGAAGEVAEAVAKTARSRRPATVTATLPAAYGGTAFELTLVALPASGPASEAAPVLVVGRSVSLDLNLRNALVESRQRYKDLVACSADFAWETDSDGRFVFVSPKGVLGFHPDEMIGRNMRDFLVPDMETPDFLPFDSNQPAEDVIVWMRTAVGRPACLKISSLPLFGPDGAWTGARGVCRDVTAARAKDLLLAIARRREQTLAAIVRAMRNEIEPTVSLEAAARAIGHALNLSACWILRLEGEGAAYVATAFPEGVEPPPPMLGRLVEMARGERPGHASAAEVARALLAPSLYAQSVNGGVAISRDDNAGWGDDDRDLLLGIAGHVGMAIEQAAIHEKLQHLSRTDSLTGLLNRRAFMDEAGRRLSHAQRTRRPAAILYIDLDNFKALNDHFGHRAGDEALRSVTAMISGTGRASDVAARFGGDEVVIWLDETNLDGATAKAEALIELANRLDEIAQTPGRPFALSVGVAAFDPEVDESLESLVERADRGMYKAKKRRGVSNYGVAGRDGAAAGGRTRR